MAPKNKGLQLRFVRVAFHKLPEPMNYKLKPINLVEQPRPFRAPD